MKIRQFKKFVGGLNSNDVVVIEMKRGMTVQHSQELMIRMQDMCEQKKINPIIILSDTRFDIRKLSDAERDMIYKIYKDKENLQISVTLDPTGN